MRTKTRCGHKDACCRCTDRPEPLPSSILPGICQLDRSIHDNGPKKVVRCKEESALIWAWAESFMPSHWAAGHAGVDKPRALQRGSCRNRKALEEKRQDQKESYHMVIPLEHQKLCIRLRAEAPGCFPAPLSGRAHEAKFRRNT